MIREVSAAAALALTLTLVGTAGAVTPGETNPLTIMRGVAARDEGDRQSARMTMVVVPSAGRKVTRAIRLSRIGLGGVNKRLLLFESPAEERNTGLLVFDYDAPDRADDQWLYLPSLRKATRIANSEKSSSFMGSDFSYSDLTKQSADSYDYKLLKATTTVNGEESWLIQATPKNADIRSQTGYLTVQLWVSKSKLMVLQVKAQLSGSRTKLIKFDDIRQVDGVWIAHKLAARTMRGSSVESTTFLTLTDVKLKDTSMAEGDFTLQRLERGL
jgi:outer membrane lipoprotein-sorting protein